MLKAIDIYLGLPVKSVVVENKKKYSWCDLSMIFVFILEPKKKANTYMYSQNFNMKYSAKNSFFTIK